MRCGAVRYCMATILMIVLCVYAFAHKYGIYFQSQAQNMYKYLLCELSVYLLIFDVIAGSISFWHGLIQPFLGIPTKHHSPRSFAADMRIYCVKPLTECFSLSVSFMFVQQTLKIDICSCIWLTFALVSLFSLYFFFSLSFSLHLFIIYVRRAVEVMKK